MMQGTLALANSTIIRWTSLMLNRAVRFPSRPVKHIPYLTSMPAEKQNQPPDHMPAQKQVQAIKHHRTNARTLNVGQGEP